MSIEGKHSTEREETKETGESKDTCNHDRTVMSSG
jgi:hypothetical protein